jgi:hypothetical protein
MNINIYFEEWPRVLHVRLITIENCQHMQHVIDVPNDMYNHILYIRLFLRGCGHALFRTT